MTNYIIKFEEIFKNLNFNFKIKETTTFKLYLKNYLNSVCEEDKVEIIEKIYNCTKKNYTNNKLILFNEMKINNDELYIIAIFILKSLCVSNLLKNSSNKYLNTDDILNEIIENYKNLYIFYTKKEIKHEKVLEIRGEIFKILNILVLNEIVKSTKNYSMGKTIEYLYLENKLINPLNIENLKISPTPLKLIPIDDNYYLIGEFFTLIKKVFVENSLSNYYFKLNNIEYLENLLKIKTYINMHDFKEALEEIEKENFKFEKINEIVEEKKKEIEENKKKIKEKNSNLKNKLTSIIEFKELSFLETKKKIIEIFIEYANNFINEKLVNWEKEEEEQTINLIYEEFIETFKNAYFKITFKNLKEFLDWKTKLMEYGYSENNENNENFKKIINTQKKIKIEEKINPEKISFLSYLFILTKKEINKAILKSAKKIKKKEKKYIVKKNEIELEENLYIEKEKIGILSIIKFNNKKKNNLELTKIWNEIKELEKENTILQSEISKILNLYNLFSLYSHLEKNMQTDEYGNILIYFLTFFDFRGRNYYESLTSPTNNKISRFIINYGVTEINKINYKPNELSNIIQKYNIYIDKFKKKFEIKRNCIFTNDTIFWIMIAIGKMSITKKKKVEINEFLENALNFIENPKINNYTEKIEYNYLIKIVKSLNNNTIIKRCILKDATASFFQNLIRILGPKTKEIAEIANLDSTEAWYDWYTYLLEKWYEDEKKKNLITKNHIYFTRKTTKRTTMTSAYEATFPTLIKYFEEDLLKEFNIRINEEINQTFLRFYKFIKENFQNNANFIKSSSTLDKEFKEILKNGKNIIIISRVNDESNLTYYKTQTKHFDFIIKLEKKTKRIIKNYKKITKEIDTKKSMTALKANLVHFVDAMLIREINTNLYYFNKNMYISIHDSFMVDLTEISEFILIANECINKNPFNENFITYEKKFFSIFIFI